MAMGIIIGMVISILEKKKIPNIVECCLYSNHLVGVCVCDRLFFGEDVMRYRNNILVFIAVSNPVD
jgi:hypothetical protein